LTTDVIRTAGCSNGTVFFFLKKKHILVSGKTQKNPISMDHPRHVEDPFPLREKQMFPAFWSLGGQKNPKNCQKKNFERRIRTKIEKNKKVRKLTHEKKKEKRPRKPPNFFFFPFLPALFPP
jgi:hypothetical protein